MRTTKKNVDMKREEHKICPRASLTSPGARVFPPSAVPGGRRTPSLWMANPAMRDVRRRGRRRRGSRRAAAASPGSNATKCGGPTSFYSFFDELHCSSITTTSPIRTSFFFRFGFRPGSLKIRFASPRVRDNLCPLCLSIRHHAPLHRPEPLVPSCSSLPRFPC